MTYTIPAPDAADFNLAADGYTIPAGDAVDFNLADLGGGAGVYTLVPGIIVSVGTPWRPKPTRQERRTAARHGNAPERPIRRALNASQASQERPRRITAPHGEAPRKPITRRAPWSPVSAQERKTRAPHDQATPLDQASRTAPWAAPSYQRDSYRTNPHENGHPRDIQPTGRWWETDRYGEGVPGVVMDWRPIGPYTSPQAALMNIGTAPPPMQALGDFIIESAMAELEKRVKPADPIIVGPMGQGAPRDQASDLPWGPSGSRDTTLRFEYPVIIVPGPSPGETYPIPIRRLYVVSNSAQIVRVSDGRDIPAQAVTLSISMDSYAWSMTAALSGAQALALAEGTDAEPVEVDVTVNGTTWRLLVDGWTLQEAASGRRGTIRGRSRAAYLAAPYAAPRDYQETSGLNANQLAGQELPPGWTLNWTAATWFVPSGAWQYQGLAPIDAIARIAAAGGAYVQADRSEQVLEVAQRYPVAPWLWDSAATPDFQIPRDVMLQRGSTKKPGQGKNGVFLHGGSTGGILARVTRGGTAGDELLPTIVDPLITDTLPARHRGIEALAATMRQSQEQHELPLSDALGGLILPGRFIEAGHGTGAGFTRDWIGLVNGVTVSAQAQRAGDRGVNLKVRQTLEIERHHEA
jgi:hypothetical protein